MTAPRPQQSPRREADRRVQKEATILINDALALKEVCDQLGLTALQLYGFILESGEEEARLSLQALLRRKNARV